MLQETLKSNIQMQINITIGHRKFRLIIQKNANIITQIDHLLSSNNLDARYQAPILQMVHQQLQKKQKRSINDQEYQVQCIKREINQRKCRVNRSYIDISGNKGSVERKERKEGKREMEDKKNKKIEDKKVYKENSVNTHNLSDKQLYTEMSEQPNCVNVYEKWKMKEKQKDQNRTHKKTNTTKTKLQNKQKKQKQKQKQTHSTKKVQTHPPSYFYTRGIDFQKQKQTHREQLFQKQYPFTSKPLTLTPKQKNQVHQRLYSNYKTKQCEKITEKAKFLQKQQQRLNQHKIKPDKYRQKVKERDDKIDRTLNILLKNCMIQNPCRIQRVGKSPFRKTNIG